jgi:hypothetical protein
MELYWVTENKIDSILVMLYNLYTFNMNAYNSKFIRHQNQLLFKLADL